ncbi:lecithin retinol acyltransferase family protein [Acinetobacter sp. WCHA39]|uniref:lecithin retinol acyltransferase family protein n=1 Tax=Acinetobacter sp. WCHA39 TaxID=2004648 RepID=UPI00196A6172|nr:lecithin retinol acyltransferase family protein [Acinetobacter sp. WCHA39]
MGLFDFISDACSTIADAASSVADAVGEVASTTVDIVSDAASTTADIVGDITGTTVDVLSSAADSTIDVIGDVATSTIDAISGAASSTVDVIGDLAGSAVNTVGDVTSSTIDFVSDTASTALDFAVENPLTTIATVTAVAATGGAALGVMAGAAAVTGVSTAGVMGFTTATGAVTGATVAGSTGLLTSAAVVATKTAMTTTTAAQVAVAAHTVKHVGGYLIDEIKGRVQPVRGSVVYCDLTLGNGIAEHTGIYIGNNEIVHLNRHGFIEAVSPKEFLAAWTTGFNIYVSCQGDSAVGCDEAADFAESKIGNTRNYNVFRDNCHQFSAGCLIKDPENYNNFLWFLKDEAKKRLGADNWRLWDKNYW